MAAGPVNPLCCMDEVQPWSGCRRVLSSRLFARIVTRGIESHDPLD
jgi:hypothetical protein